MDVQKLFGKLKVIIITDFSKRTPGTLVISGNTSKKLFQRNQRMNP